MWSENGGLWRDDGFPFFHFVTTAGLGDMKDPAVRGGFLESAGINPETLVTANQVHGNNVEVVSSDVRGLLLPETDAIVITSKGLSAGILTADCLPVFLGVKEAGIAAVVHAGWKGLANGIIFRAVEKLKALTAGEIYASVGPHIQKCCYEVGAELKNAFGVAGEERKLDLDAIAVEQLKKSGIQYISSSGLCTSCSDGRFFSYRKDKTAKRILSLVKI
ncbi:MAG TPA: peptidoglycan editing factor PgeF [Elusimicrobia bacterium]|nr:MAG: hypothetical protein A2278_09320 [Elusimicrobia bacterium RIFOXYA12_FULL_49_49]OGS06890.1 MAG: hypothetical protein A2204_04210 [Elusimicrobia bacterium RIFOXYA1_FULL_47_7]OGS10174.1 MAG: hypothetical protein A2386_01560 [Elusimicrobia bacterium RIFOXYB1_FULL_48_9]OGS14983.1 MAG: hypothetical protein A2251_08175 [Elusimicrobia bacterium RIFOXYA2_FULL_47_53]OGS26082.1 MAG: hypothetical protein A2339_02100 [Elusimicrobia bacterium RIFOXYB12_FULL_50_12]OGS29327.1 MAG: hypothetical protein